MTTLDRSISTVARGLLLALSIAGSGFAAEPIHGESARNGAISGTAVQNVLTLEEAARLLRVEPSELAELALQRGIPGRRIGKKWRFSREALLAWLAGSDRWQSLDSTVSDSIASESIVNADAADKRVASAMSASDLESVVGRGPEDGGEGRSEPEVSDPEVGEQARRESEEGTAGEPPVAKRADEIFLRRKRLLLDRGQFIVEPWFSYSKGEETAIKGYNLELGSFGQLNVPQLFREEQETTSVALAVRYGLFRETELYVMGRYRYRNLTERSHHRDPSTPTAFGGTEPEGSSHLGRIYLGVRRTMVREGPLFPDVVLSAEVGIPISKTSYSLGTGLWLVRSYDPISIFAGVEFRHTFSRNFDALSLLEPENLIGLSLGYAFAVNDQLSFSTSVSALFSDETEFESDLVMKSDESYGLRMAVTYMFREGVYVEPHVTIGLSGPGSWMLLGVSIPMTFGD